MFQITISNNLKKQQIFHRKNFIEQRIIITFAVDKHIYTSITIANE